GRRSPPPWPGSGAPALRRPCSIRARARAALRDPPGPAPLPRARTTAISGRTAACTRAALRYRRCATPETTMSHFGTLFASLLILLAAGCAAPPSSEPAEEETGQAQEEQNTHNTLTDSSLTFNSITTNRSALSFLRTHSLASAVSGAYNA